MTNLQVVEPEGSKKLISKYAVGDSP